MASSCSSSSHTTLSSPSKKRKHTHVVYDIVAYVQDAGMMDPLADPEKTEKNAKEILAQTPLESGHEFEGREHVGTPSGMSLLERVNRSIDELSFLRNEVKSLRQQVSAQRTAETDLNTEFRHVRARFLEIYKRDFHLGESNSNVIRAGNRAAHSGNCVADAGLYEPPLPRHDEGVFIQLYGMSPSAIMKVYAAGNHKILSQINCNATMEASGMITEEGRSSNAYKLVRKEFQAMIVALLDGELDVDPEVLGTVLNEVYSRFISAVHAFNRQQI